MNLLQLVTQASAEMGLPTPAYINGNTDVNVVQLVALLNAVGSELQREFPWQALDKQYTFSTQAYVLTGTTVANSAVITSLSSTTGLDTTFMVSGSGVPNNTYVQSVDSSTQVTLSNALTLSDTPTLTFGKTKYALPADWDRQADRTHYNKNKRWEMMGPETAQQWAWLQSSYISTGPRQRYRILGGYFQIWPIPGTSEVLAYEYYSTGWVTSSTGTVKTSFTTDLDTCVFPDRLMILGLKRKYFEIKGFDTRAFTRDYDAELDRAKANDQGSATLSMAPRMSSVLIGWENIPDSGYGS
jgi:hypothetical protein